MSSDPQEPIDISLAVELLEALDAIQAGSVSLHGGSVAMSINRDNAQQSEGVS